MPSNFTRHLLYKNLGDKGNTYFAASVTQSYLARLPTALLIHWITVRAISTIHRYTPFLGMDSNIDRLNVLPIGVWKQTHNIDTFFQILLRNSVGITRIVAVGTGSERYFYNHNTKSN